MSNGLPPDRDDKSIRDEDELYIRVFPDSDSLVYDPTRQIFRPSSGALKSRDNPLSADLGTLSTPEETRDRCKEYPFHVAMFTAGLARKYNCRIVRDPTPETPTSPANPAHVLVFGDNANKSGGLIPNSQSKKIAHESVVVLVNPNAPAPQR